MSWRLWNELDQEGSMNQMAQVEPAQELTAIDRARNALQYDATKAQLAELAKQSERIVEITNAAGREECHAAAMALTKQRTTITATAKAAREDATKFSKSVIAAENELLGIITPEETRLRGLRDKWDADRAAEKQAAIDAELKRQSDIQARIQGIRNIPSIVAGCSAESIADALAELQRVVVDESTASVVIAGMESSVAAFAEFAPQAQVAKDEALAKLREMHAKAVAAETEAKRIAEEQAAAAEQLRKDREELERLRAEAAERQAKADAEAKAAREEADRLAQIERDRQAEEQRAKLAAEAMERAKEELAIREARAEQDRIDRAQREAEAEQLRTERARLAEQAAELKRQQEEQAARERAERRRQEAERAAEKAEADRIETERAAAEREREIANATLFSAAHDALGLLTELGESDHIVTLKLAAALARECA